ncbi:MAG TPA: MBL fold metallo-hydrolase, partial [candidate division Zixibacteria bacterium]|nr:MBL fold metallo-hydrolase [candidate division Zixibacteria bacterium]
MKIQFFGGAQTVTGSEHLLSINGKRIMLECGLFQGKRKDSYEKNRNFPFDVTKIDAMLLSHAHIDHSGNIPNLVKNGFHNQILATYATVDLCEIMLRDTAHLQEMDVQWMNKIHSKNHQPLVEPLYTMADVEKSLSSFNGVRYNESVKVTPGVTATFLDAGHILGSAGILLEITENGRKLRVGFSGDAGRPNMPILRDPNLLFDLDVLIMESTYGNRVHPSSEDMEEELAQIVQDASKSKGKIIIPAFAVGRTQMLAYILHKLSDQGRIPNIPIYIDSPMANSATEVFRKHPECFDRETERIFLNSHEDPFGFGRLKY